VKRIYLFAAFLGCVALCLAQESGKSRPSPPTETSVTIGGKSIKINYSAPSVRGRKIFGGHEAYETVWRAGANEATALHSDADLVMGDLAVPKGDYTLYVYLNPQQWKLIVNKQTGQWGTEYSQAQDLGRIPMTMSKPSSLVETLKITLSATGANKGQLQMAWENTVASVPFTVK
jgi:hypothetical protein